MTDKEKMLIRFVAEGDLKRAQSQAKIILDGITTQKDQNFKETMLKKMDGAYGLIRLPDNIKNLFRVEDPVNFVEGRYLLREAESAIAEKAAGLYKAAGQLAEMGLPYAPALLLHGDSGCGKTELARYIAFKIGLPFVVVRFSNLIMSTLGSTQANIAKVFDYVRNNPCVLCFDEIDAVGLQRGNDLDVGEMARVTIALMQELDQMPGNVLIVGTTNRFDRLDPALVRRIPMQYKVEPLTGDEAKLLAGRIFDHAKLDTEGWFDVWCSKNLKWKTAASTVVKECTEVVVQKVLYGDSAPYLKSSAGMETTVERHVPESGGPAYPLNLIRELTASDIKFESQDQLDGLTHVLSELTDGEQVVLHRHYALGQTLACIAKDFGVTRERVRQVEVKALRKLRHPSRMQYILYGLAAVKTKREETEKAKEEDAKRVEWEEKQRQQLLLHIASVIVDKQRLKGKITPTQTLAVVEAGFDPIENLDLSVRAYNCLKRAMVFTINDALQLSYDEILIIRNMGRRSADEVAAKLRDFIMYAIYKEKNAEDKEEHIDADQDAE